MATIRPGFDFAGSKLLDQIEAVEGVGVTMPKAVNEAKAVLDAARTWTLPAPSVVDVARVKPSEVASVLDRVAIEHAAHGYSHQVRTEAVGHAVGRLRDAFMAGADGYLAHIAAAYEKAGVEFVSAYSVLPVNVSDDPVQLVALGGAVVDAYQRAKAAAAVMDDLIALAQSVYPGHSGTGREAVAWRTPSLGHDEVGTDLGPDFDFHRGAFFGNRPSLGLYPVLLNRADDVTLIMPSTLDEFDQRLDRLIPFEAGDE